MPRARLLPALLASAILSALPIASAYAQQPPPQRERGQGNDRSQRSPRDEGRSLSDAVRRVERNTRGEVLSAERVQYDGRDMHRVKVVDDQGRVRVFMQDPARQDRNSGNDSTRRSNRDNGQRSRQRGRPTRDDDN